MAIGSLHAQEPAVDTTRVDTTAIAPIAPVTSLIAEDFKYDDGNKVVLSWVPSIDDVPITGRVIRYDIYQVNNEGEPHKIAEVLPETVDYEVDELERDSSYI